MKKKLILLPFLFLIITGLFFGGLVFAQGKSDSKVQNDFITKVSSILGLEEEIVTNAFNEAVIQIYNEKKTKIDLGIQNKINSGIITEEEANEWRTKFLKKKTPTFNEFLGMRGKKGKKGKPYVDGLGPDNKGKGPRSKIHVEEIKEKINKAVKAGEITQEEADAKLKNLEGKPYMNGLGPDNKGKGLRNKMDLEEIKEKINKAVKAGEITQEEADAKLQSLEKRKESFR